MKAPSVLDAQDGLPVQARHRLSRTPDFPCSLMERDCSSFSSDALDLHRSVWMSGIDEMDNPSDADRPNHGRVRRCAESAGTETEPAKTDVFPARHGQGAGIRTRSNPLTRRCSCCSRLRRYREKTVQLNMRTSQRPAISGVNVASSIWSTLAVARGATGIRRTRFLIAMEHRPGFISDPGPGFPSRFDGQDEGMNTCR